MLGQFSDEAGERLRMIFFDDRIAKAA